MGRTTADKGQGRIVFMPCPTRGLTNPRLTRRSRISLSRSVIGSSAAPPDGCGPCDVQMRSVTWLTPPTGTVLRTRPGSTGAAIRRATMTERYDGRLAGLDVRHRLPRAGR